MLALLRRHPLRRVGKHGQGAHGGGVPHLLFSRRGGRRRGGYLLVRRPTGPQSDEGGEGNHVVEDWGKGAPAGQHKEEVAGTTGGGWTARRWLGGWTSRRTLRVN